MADKESRRQARRVIREIHIQKWKEKRARWRKENKGQILIAILCFGMLAAALLLLWHRSRPQKLAIPPESLQIYVLNVGQGDAIFLRTDEKNVLIDTGIADSAYPLLHQLRSLGVEQLDCLVISHPHSDHIGGMKVLLDNMTVLRCVMPEFPAELTPTSYTYSNALAAIAKQGLAIDIPACHETYSLGCAELEFLSVDNSGWADLNNCSLCCRVRCGKYSFFFAGDLETAGELAFLDAGLLTPCDLLKTAHHGSNGATSSAFLDVLRPKLAVISCEPNNAYGHPGQKCLSRLEDAGAAIFRTDIDGHILFVTDGNKLQYQTDFVFDIS